MPEDHFCALGGGENIVSVTRSLDLVIVARWIEGPYVDGLLGRMASACNETR
jgi:hypothetical protein